MQQALAHWKIVCIALFSGSLCFRAFSQEPAPVADTLSDHRITNRITLPNGWSLSPAGHSLTLGDLPLNMALSSKNYLAVTNNGQSVQTLQLIDVRTERIVDSIMIPKSWFGLKFSADGKFLYASGGNDNRILKYAVNYPEPGPGPHRRGLILVDSILLGNKRPEKISPAGLDIDDRKKLLYVVTKENNSLYIIDLVRKTVLHKTELGGEGYSCLLSENKKELYISCWGCDKLLIFDTESRTISGEIKVGDNPNDLCLTRNGNWLFVANANDNAVSVIDIRKRLVVETLNAALYADAPPGSTTNALALSGDQKTLYVANADNNCLTVFDVSKPGASRSKGFIPVGWYPTSLKIVGKKIWVANGKGFSSMANPFGPSPVNRKEEVRYQKGVVKKEKEVHPVQYIGGLFKGGMSIINEPDEKTLEEYSAQVYQNTPYTKPGELLAKGEQGNPVPMRVGDPSPLKYVFYIIKENRTYDQVLGDVKEGNGDSSLVLFGERITPNQHALAREFVLLDNFYVDAEVSADGHNWSMGGYATDYLEKTWPTSYGGRGGAYDGEGKREIANNKGGFIWDFCQRGGVSFRTYGEFADNYKPNIKVLQGHYCLNYTGWDMGVKDTVRVGQWKRDFDSLLAANALPRFNTLRLGNDHTEGLRKGRPTPFAHVADNDLAVGEFVEYLSLSPIWKESVIFILEDDAQNGPDHVDAHRSPVYLAGGLVKRHFVDHTMYSTTSVLRTIELILGIPPMSQYDAAAEAMWRCFTTEPDHSPFHAVPARVDLTEKNIAWNEMAKKSAGLDFTREDRIPDLLFNEILWKGIRGLDAKLPAPRRAAFVKARSGDDD
ncbi:bifunctional YncE family protein/alkaline phosphatase family protein [Flavitalea flava]